MQIAASIFCALAVAFAASELRAEMILAYDLQGEPGTQTANAPVFTATNTTGLPLTRGAGLISDAGYASGGNTLSSTGWDSRGANDYITFGFSIDPGYAAQLEQLQLRTGAQFTGPSSIGLFSNADGFASPIATFTHAGVSPGTTSVSSAIVDLQGLPQLVGDVEFRLYSLSDTAAGGGTVDSQGVFFVGNFHSGRDIQLFSLSGSLTAVPEPSSLTFAMSSLLFLLGTRRRRLVR